MHDAYPVVTGQFILDSVTGDNEGTAPVLHFLIRRHRDSLSARLLFSNTESRIMISISRVRASEAPWRTAPPEKDPRRDGKTLGTVQGSPAPSSSRRIYPFLSLPPRLIDFQVRIRLSRHRQVADKPGCPCLSDRFRVPAIPLTRNIRFFIVKAQVPLEQVIPPCQSIG